jgi:hypothetical protein
MLRRVGHVRTDVSEELSASFIGMRRIGELGTTLTSSVVPSSPIFVANFCQAIQSIKLEFKAAGAWSWPLTSN